MSLLTSGEVKKHNTKKSLWIVIKNDVYDVTSYLNEHPGGEDPLLEAAGQDATRAFEDVGHSEDARQIMKKYKIGSLAKGESWRREVCTVCKSPPPRPSGSKLKWALLALAVAIIVGVSYKKYVAS